MSLTETVLLPVGVDKMISLRVMVSTVPKTFPSENVLIRSPSGAATAMTTVDETQPTTKTAIQPERNMERNLLKSSAVIAAEK